MRRKNVPDITERIEGKAGFSEVFVNVCLRGKEKIGLGPTFFSSKNRSLMKSYQIPSFALYGYQFILGYDREYKVIRECAGGKLEIKL